MFDNKWALRVAFRSKVLLDSHAADLLSSSFLDLQQRVSKIRRQNQLPDVCCEFYGLTPLPGEGKPRRKK